MTLILSILNVHTKWSPTNTLGEDTIIAWNWLARIVCNRFFVHTFQSKFEIKKTSEAVSWLELCFARGIGFKPITSGTEVFALNRTAVAAYIELKRYCCLLSSCSFYTSMLVHQCFYMIYYIIYCNHKNINKSLSKSLQIWYSFIFDRIFWLKS